MNVGILAVGAYLPETVRENTWWPTSVVEGWKQRRARRFTHSGPPAGVVETEGVRQVVAAMEKYEADPFQGGLQRRVVSAGMTSTDMEVAAARDAIERSGLKPAELDFVLLQSACPDYVIVNNASALQQRLGLREDCLAVETQGACNGFLLQLSLGEALIRSGRARRGLVVQCSPLSRLMDPAEPFSVWFGDGASAAVLGPVPDGEGILGLSNRADGSTRCALLGTVDGQTPWYEQGSVRIRAIEPLLGRIMLLRSADMAQQVIGDALTAAGKTAQDVTFYAGHQANCWFREVSQTIAGLSHARSLDTYPWAGNLAGANLPLVMAVAQREGLLKKGDLVAGYAGGGGMTWSAAIMRWSC